MRKLLAAVALALTLLGAAPAQSQYVFDGRTLSFEPAKDITIEKFWQAYGIAVAVYGHGSPPRGVHITSSFIFSGDIAGYYDLPTTQIWINADVLTDEAERMLVLIHEIGHHILTQQGMPIEQQHCQMYNRFDPKALLLLGVPEEKHGDYINPFMAMAMCLP